MTRISIALPALLLPLAVLTAAPAAADPSDCFNPQMCADPGQGHLLPRHRRVRDGVLRIVPLAECGALPTGRFVSRHLPRQ